MNDVNSPVAQWLARIENDSDGVDMKSQQPPDEFLPCDTRRAPLAFKRRGSLNVTVSDETRAALDIIGHGNKSAAIEELVRLYVIRL